jgi:hypothetical protein
MTFTTLVIFTFLEIVLTTIAKLVFIQVLDIDNIYITYLFWLIILVVTIANTRRLGVLNYLESFLIMGLWLFLALLFDMIVVAAVAGVDIYKHMYLWVSYLIIIGAVFLFHKKRHVELRNQMAGK